MIPAHTASIVPCMIPTICEMPNSKATERVSLSLAHIVVQKYFLGTTATEQSLPTYIRVPFEE